MKNVEQFLKKLGIKSATIKVLTGAEELTEEQLESIVTEVKTESREAFENDPDFIEKIKAPLTAKERGALEGKIKKAFGLSSEEIKDKKIDEIIELAREKVKSLHTGTAQELQDKLSNLAAENKRLLEEVIPSKEAEAASRVKAYRKNLILRDKVSKKGDSLLVDVSVIMPALNEALNKNYNIDVDDDDNIIIKTKKDGLDPLRDDKTGKLTFEEILDRQLTDLKVIKQSNAVPGGTPPPPTFTPGGGAGPKYNLPGLAKAKQNEIEMGKMRQFGQ